MDKQYASEDIEISKKSRREQDLSSYNKQQRILHGFRWIKSLVNAIDLQCKL